MIPSHFKPKFDSSWFPWVKGHVDGDMLRAKVKSAEGKPTYVNGCEVFALRFENKAEWNVKDGWK